MDRNSVKKKLAEYRKLMARVEQLNIDIQLYESSRDELIFERDKCLASANFIEKAIKKENDLKKREILVRKYIYGDTLEEIADRLSFSSRHIQRLLNSAAEQMVL